VPEPQLTKDFAQQLLAEIKAEDAALTKKRPPLVGFTMKMPLGTKRQLKKAAKKEGVTQSAIVLKGLKLVLPHLLAEQERQQDLELNDDDEG